MADVTALNIQQSNNSMRSYIQNALSFPTMHHRESNISDAHTSTLSWILDDEPLFSRYFSKENWPVSEFRSWLQDAEGKPIFWISGKAGSGKSTLMKWIYENPRLRQRLSGWSEGKELLLCHFFFFERGDVLQKSREGLLRSILLQLFEAKNELVETAFPDFFNNTALAATPPPVPLNWEFLKAALKRVLDFAVRQDWRICMFIDGLDEYRNNDRAQDFTEEDLAMIYDDGEEDTAWGQNTLISDNHKEVVEFFIELAKQPRAGSRLKMCLSGRDIPIFDLKFSEFGFPRFRLHEHTKGDIRRYVSERLSLPVLRLDPGDCDCLVSEIADKARGVFLWVRLVVNLVSEKRIAGKKVPQLRELLQSVPPQLGGKKGLYMSILQNISSEDQLESSRLIRILQATSTWNPLDPAIASYALQHYGKSGLDVDEVVGVDICLHNPLNLKAEREAYRLRIRSRFCGMFECESPDYQIDFVHQTAKEFFSWPSVWEQLYGYLGDEGFNANLALLAGHIMLIKATGKDMVHSSVRQFGRAYVWVADAMHYAELADRQNSDQQAYIRLVDELDRAMTTISMLIVPCTHDSQCHWPHWEAEKNPGFLEDYIMSYNPLNTVHGWPHRGNRLTFGSKVGFLSYAALGSLVNYMRAKMAGAEDESRALKASNLALDFCTVNLFLLYHRKEFGDVESLSRSKLYTGNRCYFPLGCYLGTPGVMEFLLDIGANPNKVWRHFLLRGYYLFLDGLVDTQLLEDLVGFPQELWGVDKERWIEILGLFLKHGLEHHKRVGVLFYFGDRGRAIPKKQLSYMVADDHSYTERDPRGPLRLEVDLSMMLGHFFGGKPEYRDTVHDIMNGIPAAEAGTLGAREDIQGAENVFLAALPPKQVTVQHDSGGVHRYQVVRLY